MQQNDMVSRVKTRLAQALVYPPVVKYTQWAGIMEGMQEALAQAEGIGLHHSDDAQLVDPFIHCSTCQRLICSSAQSWSNRSAGAK